MEQVLGELLIVLELLQNIRGKSLKGLVAGGIFFLHADFAGVHPVLGDGVLQKVRHGNDLIGGPVNVGLVLRVDAVADEDVLILEHLHDIALVVLVFFGQYVVRLPERQHLLAEFGKRRLLIGAEGRPDLLLRGLGIFCLQMRNIDDIVVEHLEIDIIDGNHDVRAVLVLSHVIGLGINDPVVDDVRKLPLQDVLRRDLKVMVDGEVDVIARDRSDVVTGLQLISHVVNVNVFRSLGSLKLGFERGLNAGFSDHIAARVGRILLLQGLQLIGADPPGIAENLGKILAVVVAADRVVRDVNALQTVLVLQNRRDGFLGDVLGNRGGDIFLIAVQIEKIADRDELQEPLRIIPLFRNEVARIIRRVLSLSDPEALRKVPDHVVRGCIRLVGFQIADVGMAVHIGKKTRKRRPAYREVIVA